MPTKQVISLSYNESLSLGTAVELVGLATGGEVRDYKVSSLAASYIFAKSLDKTVQVKSSRERSAAEFKSEVERVRSVLLLQSKAIDERTNLVLDDLEEIWAALAVTKQPVNKLMQDSEFQALFPYAELVAGTYEELRHNSGCTISLVTRRDGTIISHRLDAPICAPDTMSAIKSCGVFDAEGYLGSDASRWRISKLLGAVPQSHKSRVFAWAADAIYTVNEYHNTKGGISLPEIFEYNCDGVHLQADRELRFERKA
ncbi:MAG: hypothetical protein K2Y32_05140 [Candidatus Obscuribacterales bacterium]|nr:hypothetical protein [Candidatus Obscuribacterales bacterium]